jgi:hypothetical protein
MTQPSASTADAIRNAAGIGGDTIIQLLLLPGTAELYLGNVTVPGRFDPYRIAGFCVRGQDLRLDTAETIAHGHGIDQEPGWVPGSPLYGVRFVAQHPSLFQTSYGGRTPEGAAGMGTANVFAAPFLGTGYTSCAEYPVPEYILSLIELPVGTEMYRMDTHGDHYVGAYGGRHIGWQLSDKLAPYGPLRWYPAPMPMHPTVRRGFVATYQGTDFDADLGPGVGKVTLHPLPGARPPADFVEQYGARIRTVDHSELDRLGYLRQLCTWRGAEFELLELHGDRATLHYLGNNYLHAQQLDLVPAAHRQWRTVIARSELGTVRPDLSVLPVVGLFGSS